VSQSSYTYDSTVQNHRRVAVGDLAVVRDGTKVHGVATVERIDSKIGVTKTRSRCPNPECRSTSFKPRTTRTTKFLCTRCRLEFDEPSAEPITVTGCVARFGTSWCSINGRWT
jgi:hypothetical protein